MQRSTQSSEGETDGIPTLDGCVTLNKLHDFAELYLLHLIILLWTGEKDNECKTCNMVLPYRIHSIIVRYYVDVTAAAVGGIVFSRLNA